VCGTSGDNGAVVNVGREGLKAPCFRQSEKGEDVNRQQDGGKWGALGGAMVEDNFREGLAVKGQSDPSVREEGTDPVAERRGVWVDCCDVARLY